MDDWQKDRLETKELMMGVASRMSRFARIVTGKDELRVEWGSVPNSVAGTDHQTITFNSQKMDVTDLTSMAMLYGVTLHECGHILYSPPMNSPWRHYWKGMYLGATVFSVAEDSRLETRLSTKYPGVEKFFDVMIIKHVFSHGVDGRAWFFVAGREQCDPRIRKVARDAWAGSDTSAAEVQTLFQEYTRLDLSAETKPELTRILTRLIEIWRDMGGSDQPPCNSPQGNKKPESQELPPPPPTMPPPDRPEPPEEDEDEDEGKEDESDPQDNGSNGKDDKPSDEKEPDDTEDTDEGDGDGGDDEAEGDPGDEDEGTEGDDSSPESDEGDTDGDSEDGEGDSEDTEDGDDESDQEPGKGSPDSEDADDDIDTDDASEGGGDDAGEDSDADDADGQTGDLDSEDNPDYDPDYEPGDMGDEDSSEGGESHSGDDSSPEGDGSAEEFDPKTPEETLEDVLGDAVDDVAERIENDMKDVRGAAYSEDFVEKRENVRLLDPSQETLQEVSTLARELRKIKSLSSPGWEGNKRSGRLDVPKYVRTRGKR